MDEELLKEFIETRKRDIETREEQIRQQKRQNALMAGLVIAAVGLVAITLYVGWRLDQINFFARLVLGG